MITVEGKEVFTELPELVDPAHTALLLIDMQRDFVEADGAFGTLGIDLSMYRDSVPRLERLLSDARRATVLVIHVQNTTLAGRMSDSPAQIRFNLRMHAGSRHDGVPLRYSVEGTPGHEFIKDLTPETGEPVVRKHRSSAFWGTNLELLLRSNGIKTVVIGGCTTEGCVESTARDALFNDLYVVIAADCVASDDREQHDASLLLMRHRFDMATSDEIAAVWAPAPPPPARATTLATAVHMRITDVIAVPVRSGFFADDQAAIRAGAVHDGFTYSGAPLTAGFRTIRQPGEAVSVLLILDDGQAAHGDCAAVQYSGVSGREPLFLARPSVQVIERHVASLLRGRQVTNFRDLAGEIDALVVDGDRLHAAIRYGLAQALLDGVARARGVTMAEVVRDEYSTGIVIAPVPLFVQSGDERYANVDKMVLKEADVLPHGLINEIDTKLGRNGELLLDYVAWVRDRIIKLRVRSDYSPRLHFDVYGTIGQAFDGDVDKVAEYLQRLGAAAQPFAVCVEHAIDAGSREAQVRVFAALRSALRARGSGVRIAVDEWCNTLEDIEIFVAADAADVIHVKTPDLGGINNTIEALLLVARHGLAAYCGGSCNETDRSAQVSAHIAMACGATQVLAKPGMGVDEGMMIVGNEMARVAALVAARRRTPV